MRSAADLPSLIDDADFLAELDRMENGPAPPDAEPAPKPAGPDKLQHSQPRRLKLEPPATPATPPRREAPIRPEPETPMPPAHIAEIGDRARAPRAAVHVPAPSATVAAPIVQPRGVPAALAALTVVVGLTVGAGSAALLFHDRVAQIVVTWAK
jgi:hypothetical protein